MASERKRSRRKEERPQEILDAALESFAEQGFAATKMSDIAQRAGIAKGTIYRYFETKEALFEAIVRSGVQPFQKQASEIVLSPDISAEEMLRTMIGMMYRSTARFRERKIILMLLIAEGAKFPHLVDIFYRAVMMEGEEILARLFERGVSSGEFRNSPATREPRVVIGPEIMATIWLSVFASVSPLNIERFEEAHVDLVLHGILNPDRAKPRSDSAHESKPPKPRLPSGD